MFIKLFANIELMIRRILFILLICFSVDNIEAQQALSTANNAISTSNTDAGKLYDAANQKHKAARAIEFAEQTITASNFIANINRHFNIPPEFSFVETESNTDKLGMKHHFMEQYYKGIPLEGLGYRVHEKNGFVTSANGKAIRDINIDIKTTLSEEEAFGLAVEFLQSKDSIFRSGKKLIVSKNFTYAAESFAVAYQFDIDVSLIERWRISIDARNGEILNKLSLVKTCFETQEEQFVRGTGMTNYYGSKTIPILKYDDGSSRLTGQTEHGGNIHTLDFRNAPIIAFYFGGKAYPFYSTDSTYNQPYHQPAVSVQWAAEQAFEYYFNIHGRNSYNNLGADITSYVHVDENWDNAAWTGKLLVFGDGSNNNPLVELDVVSHELTHGVTDYEADLTYSFEPGALNESFSDILAKAVEFSRFGDTATWQLGKHYIEGGLRDMSNPNLKDQPDTYWGDMWYDGFSDYGGVHTNSGVQNFWFYLLCEGGSGVNDRGIDFSVNSIGIEAAANIAYRNLTEYLISSSDYLDSRIGSLLATADLYGVNSSIYQEVEKAWDAVGVINEPIIQSFDLYDITATTVKFNGNILPRGDTVTYHIEYGITPSLGDSTIISDYEGSIEGIITGLQSETKYYIRLVATNENGNSYDYRDTTTISLAPLVRINTTIDVTDTSATLYGQINPNSLPTSYYFRYGPSREMELATATFSLPDTTEYLDISVDVQNLQPRQSYYYKLIATNVFAQSLTDSVRFFTALKPVVNAISPISARVGEEVIITGQHFNTTPEDNWVNFGATKGKVTSSNVNEIRAEVPVGASFGPIAVMDAESGLYDESVQEFVPTFSGTFEKGGFQLRAGFNDFSVRNLFIHDLDKDGRPDIFASHNDGFTIFQNLNNGEDITNGSFYKSNFPFRNFSFFSIFDIDGNGLDDVIGRSREKMMVIPNLSVPGYMYFGPPVELSPAGNYGYLQLNDFDNDGRNDIMEISYVSIDSSLLKIYRNKNPQGMLSPEKFEEQYRIYIPVYAFQPRHEVSDLNNDKYPDIMYSNYSEDTCTILINKSTPGNIDFEEIQLIDSVHFESNLYIANDLNNDGQKDIVLYGYNKGRKLTILENNGSNIELSKPQIVLEGLPVRTLQAGDIDGDGKVDLMAGNMYYGGIAFIKNKTETGQHFSDVSFELFEEYGKNNDPGYALRSSAHLNDLNGDGRPDAVSILGKDSEDTIGYRLGIWQNAPGDCPDPPLIHVTMSGTSATIKLPDNLALDQLEMAYASNGYNNWVQISSTTLSNLKINATYQLRARARCYLGFTAYSYIDFATECVDLANFSVNNIRFTDVFIYASDLSSFEVQYSEAGKDQWIETSQYINQISNLRPGTTYDLRYRGRCNTPTVYRYMQFTTLCPAISTLSIDELSFNKAVVNWTSSYAGDAIFEYSEDNVTWTLIDDTRILFPLIPGNQYTVRGSLACTNINSGFIYASFTTPCPQVSMLNANSITPVSANIDWDDESATGRYIIRYPTTAGEEEKMITNSTSFYVDGLTPGTRYTVSVAPYCIGENDFYSTTFTSSCPLPENISADAITHTRAEISWNDDFSSLSYTIEYSIVGSDDWIKIKSTSTRVLLEELRPGTEYEARVYINCISVEASYAYVRFETRLYDKTVLAPNPTENIITIYPSKNLIGNRYGLYDSTGRRVAGGNLHDYTFDLSSFATGIYILKIDKEKPIKIIKR